MLGSCAKNSKVKGELESDWFITIRGIKPPGSTVLLDNMVIIDNSSMIHTQIYKCIHLYIYTYIFRRKDFEFMCIYMHIYSQKKGFWYNHNDIKIFDKIGIFTLISITLYIHAQTYKYMESSFISSKIFRRKIRKWTKKWIITVYLLAYVNSLDKTRINKKTSTVHISTQQRNDWLSIKYC